MALSFRKATKKKRKLRLALIGPSGSGKTYSALSIATGLSSKIALIDTEGSAKDNSGGSAELYAGRFSFDTCILPDYHPSTYVEAIRSAEDAGYDVIIIDSLSHAWFGNEGALELVNKEMARQKTSNQYTAWRNVTPLHNALVQSIIHSACRVIVTMRAKEKYVMEADDRGKQSVKKLGMEAIQREGLNFEFDLVGDMDMDHNFCVSKTRIEGFDGDVIKKPGIEVAKRLLDFLNSGDDVEQAKPDIEFAPAQETSPESVTDCNPLPLEKPEPIPDKPKATVADVLAKLPSGLEKLGAKDVGAALDSALTLIALEFGVEDTAQIPDTAAEKVREFMRTGMITQLRNSGQL